VQILEEAGLTTDFELEAQSFDHGHYRFDTDSSFIIHIRDTGQIVGLESRNSLGIRETAFLLQNTALESPDVYHWCRFWRRQA